LSDEERSQEIAHQGTDRGAASLPPADYTVVCSDFDDACAAVIKPTLRPAKRAIERALEIVTFDAFDAHDGPFSALGTLVFCQQKALSTKSVDKIAIKIYQ